jgi:molybdopterin-containing oxidoreductase family membrane subunit
MIREQTAAERRRDDPYFFAPGDMYALTDRLTHLVGANKRAWRLWITITGLGTLVLFTALTYTFITGIGVWGNNIPVGWAFAITNFVWWIGIGHAGTFISAILLLLEQRWRTSINRFAEAMTLFAVANAALFPLAHLGRPWFFYWLVPYPMLESVWPQFRSALTWDVVAISTYGLVSLLFWYTGLLPDLASARDINTVIWKRKVYGVFALGWRGAARHWRHYRVVYGLLGGFATPLVISVHSVVSMDFATGKVPGWHSTLFPPYFVAGAIFSGFAMVITLAIPMRSVFKLHDLITERHLDAMGQLMLVTGGVVAYAYLFETFMAWWTDSPFDKWTVLHTRPFGPWGWLYWTMIFCNVLVPQLMWLRSFRRNPITLFGVAILVNVGMWVERFVLIAGSLTQDFLPSAWHLYKPTIIDGTIFFGTLFFFAFLFLLFLRLVPFIPIAELKELKHELEETAHGQA